MFNKKPTNTEDEVHQYNVTVEIMSRFVADNQFVECSGGIYGIIMEGYDDNFLLSHVVMNKGEEAYISASFNHFDGEQYIGFSNPKSDLLEDGFDVYRKVKGESK